MGFHRDGVVMRCLWLTLVGVLAVVVVAACGSSKPAHRSGSSCEPNRPHRPGCSPTSKNAPSNMSAPAVIDTTLLNNYEEPDVVQSSVGSWSGCGGGSPCTYSYQIEDCGGVSSGTGTGCANISSARCSNTSARTCNYRLATGDVGHYIVSSVTAANRAGSSAPVVTQAVGPVRASRVETFCSIAAAYTDLATGPHLCGWPDSTNTGYVNAPGYPGGLTAASSGSSACPTVPQSNHTYEFCDYVGGLNLPAGLANVTFYGDEFYSTNPNEANVAGGRGDNNLTFAYDTFQPEQASPPVTCAESYEYGISNEGGEIGKLTVEHSNFWGFAAAVDTEGSTQANPQVMSYNWIHDASASSGCGYHPDGIGMLGGGTEEYAIVDHNTIEFTADTNGANLIAWQNGTYAHDQNTNNLLSGDGEGYAGGRCTSSCTQPSYITSTGNTYSTYLQASSGEGPIDGASNFWSGTGNVWNHNYWAVPPGAFWGTPAYNGYYWVPTGNTSNPQDCGFISKTDYPNYSNPSRCR